MRNPKHYAVINLGMIQKFLDSGKLGTEITETELVDSGVVRRKLDGIRVLAKGEITSVVTITVTGASKAAIDAVAKAGGTLTITKAVASADTAE
jgi:large subunit ribosomal protein L15